LNHFTVPTGIRLLRFELADGRATGAVAQQSGSVRWSERHDRKATIGSHGPVDCRTAIIAGLGRKTNGFGAPIDAARRIAAQCAAMLRRAALLLCTLLGLSGCSVAALPCRVTADVVGVVPVAGSVVAAPFDACAGLIDH
jgi:uncharacterized protein DUF6726